MALLKRNTVFDLKNLKLNRAMTMVATGQDRQKITVNQKKESKDETDRLEMQPITTIQKKTMTLA